MLRIKNQAVALLTVLALCSGAAWVAAEERSDQESDRRIEAAFKKLDANSDGKLTLEEYKAGKAGDAATKAEAEFKTMDKNNDSSLTYAEYKDGQAQKKDEKREQR